MASAADGRATSHRATPRRRRQRRLPRDVEIALYRIFQEALNNVVKHAQAEHVEMRLVYNHPRIVARIVDNGCGFDRSHFQMGTGLRIMRRRVEELSGSFKIDSSPGQGTALRVEIPCETLDLMPDPSARALREQVRDG